MIQMNRTISLQALLSMAAVSVLIAVAYAQLANQTANATSSNLTLSNSTVNVTGVYGPALNSSLNESAQNQTAQTNSTILNQTNPQNIAYNNTIEPENSTIAYNDTNSSIETQLPPPPPPPASALILS